MAVKKLREKPVDERAKKVGQPDASWEASRADRALMRALMGGTRTMRAAQKLYLPPFEGEDESNIPGTSTTDWQRRLSQSVLFEFFPHAIRLCTAKLTGTEITATEKVPEILRDWLENIDLQGNDLHVFTTGLVAEGWLDGMAAILVDMPRLTPELAARRAAGAQITVKDLESAGLRPYWCLYGRGSLLCAVPSVAADGSKRLALAKLCEIDWRYDGLYASEPWERLKVFLSPERGQVFYEEWERPVAAGTQQKRPWKLAGERVQLFGLDDIPLVPFYTDQHHGYFEAQASYLELAHLNVRHWQQLSTLDNIERVANVPMNVLIGVDQDSYKEVRWGPNNTLLLPTGADAKVLEHSGSAIQALKDTIGKGEEVMREHSLRPFPANQSGNPTVPGEVLRGQEAASPMKSAAISLQDALEQAIVLTGKMVGLEVTEAEVKVPQDFALTALEATDLDALYKARQDRQITHATYLGGLKRRRVLDADLDVEAEIEAVAAETKSERVLTGRLDDFGADPDDPESEPDPGQQRPEPSTPPRPPQRQAGGRAA